MRRLLFLVTTMLLMVQGASAWNGSGSSGDPYLIASPADWETFATSTDEYSDTFFKLTADITVTTMRTKTFKGTFDGGGHTLTFNYTATGNNAAPFAYITGATIKNLRVAGTINTGYKFAAGIAAQTDGTTNITNCQSSVTINSSVDGDGTHGGLIGCQSSGTLTINSCLFDGELLGAKTTSCGGFVGWVSNNSGYHTYISNSLFAPANITVKAPTFCRHNSSTLHLEASTCYYITPNWTASTVQGTNANSMTTAALVTALNGSNKNWCIHRGNAIPIMVNLVISTKAQWDTFAANVGNYDSKYVQLGANIGTANDPITTMTTKSTSFRGIFDGNGKTMTVNFSADTGNEGAFRYLNDGTIMNLTITGTVTAGGNYASGLVARTSGGDCLIDNCVVNTNVAGSGYAGGIVAHGDNATKLTITNCIYGGEISKVSSFSGGILGWYNNDGTMDLVINNCLCKGIYTGTADFHPIGLKRASNCSFKSISCTNCYYTTNPHNPGGRNFTDGTKVYSILAGTDVTISGLGTATSTYEHNVITVYSHGIKYNLNSTDYYYAGGDEVVSLNLAHGSKTGYTFSNYEVSGGGSLTNLTATSATLTMTAADQTIDAQWTENVATLNETTNALDELTAMSGKQTKVTFTRSELTANSYSTMCLPFDFTAPSGCTFYAFTGVEWSTTNDQWEATITEQASATTLSAHTPYIFKCTGTSATFTNNAVIAASSYDNALVEVGATSGTDQAWKFKGTYTPLSWASADPTEPTYGFSTYVPNETIAAGTFVRFVKEASLAPFRARLIYSGTDTHLNAPRRAGANELPVIIIVRIIGINGETTSIGTLDTRTGEVTTDGWYTLGGMKLKGQPNQQGIYIHNGRKEVIR